MAISLLVRVLQSIHNTFLFYFLNTATLLLSILEKKNCARSSQINFAKSFEDIENVAPTVLVRFLGQNKGNQRFLLPHFSRTIFFSVTLLRYGPRHEKGAPKSQRITTVIDKPIFQYLNVTNKYTF